MAPESQTGEELPGTVWQLVSLTRTHTGAVAGTSDPELFLIFSGAKCALARGTSTAHRMSRDCVGEAALGDID
jgi:hypothetical protein